MPLWPKSQTHRLSSIALNREYREFKDIVTKFLILPKFINFAKAIAQSAHPNFLIEGGRCGLDMKKPWMGST